MPGYALETVEVQHERAKAPSKVRISRNVRRACALIVNEGKTRAEAAEAVGIKDDTLYKAMTKPEVKAVLNSMKGDFRTQESWKSVHKIRELRDEAESEPVQRDSAMWLAGLEGIAPVSRTEHSHIHAHQMIAPGLNISFTQPGQVIEGEVVGHMIQDQTTEPGKASINRGLSPSVPHPALRNAEAEDR